MNYDLPQRHMSPPPEPREVGICAGCGDEILADEDWLTFESGKRIHDHDDCKVAFVDRMLGLGR